MQRRCHVRKPVQIIEILKRAVTPLAIEAAHIGRPIHRHKHSVFATHLDRAFRVAGVERKFRRHLGHQLHQQGAVNANPCALDISARRLPHGNGLIVAKLAADFLQNFHRLIVDEFNRLIRHHLIGGDIAHQRGKRGHGG